MNDGMIYMR